MTQDTFSAMLRDGNDYRQIIQKVPEDSKFLLAIVADVFLSGMEAQRVLSAARDSA